MSFKLQTNFEKKQQSTNVNNNSNNNNNANNDMIINGSNLSLKDEKFISNLRNLVKEYLEIVGVLKKIKYIIFKHFSYLLTHH